MAGNSEIKEEYTSSLADLTFNSKPLISVLTILAEENIAHAKDIVEAIETHLSRVRTEVKLPVLYLIDCIIKNVGGPYTALFCQNIVSTFCSVFEQVDERTRAEMFRLRQTWNDVLPAKKLYALDVQIAQLDPAWPVTAPPPSSIHFNPKFLKTTTTTVSGGSTTTVNSKPHTTGLITSSSSTNLDPKTLSMQQKLIDKQRELLELQQKKLELELLQTQVKLQEQLKHQSPLSSSGVSTGSSAPTSHSQNLLLKPEVAKQLAITSSTNKSTSNTTNAKSKTGTHTSVMNSKLQNTQSNAVPRIAPVQNSLVNARPIRDPRLLRHQQQQQQNSSAIVISNVHLESKSKSGTQVTVDSENKNVNNKTSVRNDRIELRLVNNKGNIESHGKSKTSPHSSPLKHTQKIGNSPRKSNKFSRESKSSNSNSSLSDLSDLKSSSSSSLGSPVKRSDLSTKMRSLSKSFKIKKKINTKDKDTISANIDKDSGGVSVRSYDKVGASFRSDNKDSGVVLIRAEKKNDKHSNKSIKSGDKDSKLRKSDVTSFKDLKGSTKNRNYIRRNRNASLSPEPNQDVDLRLGAPPEKQPRIQGDTTDDKNGSNEIPSQTMDVDLRQLPSMIGKKRPSTEARESPNSKKSKTEMFDVLFGSEDIDLRQLPPVMTSPKGVERPPTPPPPIISDKIDKSDISEVREKKEPEKKDVPSKNPNLQALRAKLANAISQDKLKEPKDSGIETKKKKFQDDLRKLPLFRNRPSNIPMDKIIISAADEECINSGNMSKAQETALMKKIQAQIEIQKFRELQRREPDNLGTISLQPISDDEFDADFSASESDEEHHQKRPVEDKNTKDDQQKDDQHKEEQYKENRVREDRVPSHIAPQVSQLEETYPKFTRIMEHRDPRRGGRPWRGGRNRQKGWDAPGSAPLLRQPGMRPPLRSAPAPEPWMRPINDSWRPTGPNMYPPNNYGPDQVISNLPPHLIDQGSQSPKSNNHDIPELQYAHPDNYKFITIDGEPREIRYYDETAIVFMSAGDPREITFHNGTRRIFLDGEPFTLKFNHPYEEISIKSNMHRVRLGAPSREIFIDGNGYECYFDSNEKTIELDGNKIVVKLEPPPPQVKIGQEKRIDLVAGKTQLVVDAKNMFTVFLDAKPQVFEIDGTINTLKFVDALRAVLINDVRFEVEFGGLPKPIMLHDNKHFIRFSVLPKGITPGLANIKDMEVIQPYESPKNDDENSQGSSQPLININELFLKLVATGIVTTTASSQPEPPAPIVPVATVTPIAPITPMVVQQPKPPKPIINNFKHNFKPLDFSKPETLKGRRLPVIQNLYVGMQCSSCGMRFPPEQSIYYTQHLDWHFRQNRRGKKNIRKASSRRWYYTLSDWTNYQEIEDLEEREKNYFENQQQNQAEGGNEEGEEEIEIPCVPADPNVQMAACEVCQDKFEQFYNEEKDEWQLRMAIRVDDKTYHPLCYEDYQASLVDVTLEENKSNSIHESDNGNSGIPLLELSSEEPQKDEEKPENEEDDVMEVVDNIDDDETPPLTEDTQKEETDAKEEVVEQEEEDDDVILNEVASERIILDDDDDDDKEYQPPDDGLIPGVVVKEEPIDDGFMDIGSGLVKMKSDVVKIKTEPGDNDDGAERRRGNAADAADTTHIEVVSSIDGNVELDSGVPASSGLSGKIKINITKPLPAIVPRENRDIVSEELKTDCIDPSQPLPPGEEPVQLNVKQALKGIDLKRQPMVKKGSELTGLCSIM